MYNIVEVAVVVTFAFAACHSIILLHFGEIMPGRPWIDNDLLLLEKNYQDMSHKELAELLGRSIPGIAMKCSELGFVYDRTWTEEEVQFLVDNCAKMKYKYIAKKLGRTRRSINWKASDLKLHPDKEKKLRHAHVHDDYFKSWSPSMAYVLGFITADGCIVRNRGVKHDNVLQAYISKKDIEIVEFIKSEIAPKKNICISGDFCCLRITSKTIVHDLDELGVVAQKTGKEMLPDIPNEYKSDYLRGLMDGDGWFCAGPVYDKRRDKVYRQQCFGVCCANRQFLIDVQSQLGFGYGSIHQSKSIYRWDVRGKLQLAHLFEYLYYDGYPFTLTRKYDKFKQFYDSYTSQ
jgi:hypothetical protein